MGIQLGIKNWMHNTIEGWPLEDNAVRQEARELRIAHCPPQYCGGQVMRRNSKLFLSESQIP